jgi:REP element-mobilizing transposase RayT
MARLTRAEVFDPDEIAIVHVMNRTVRRCFLFGDDPLTGKNYDHRKVWIEQHLQHFAACFGIDLLAFSILSNHFHLVLRSRPDVVSSWSDTEVARRWLMICPHRKDARGRPAPPNNAELNSIRHCPERLQEIRSRLSNVSWWMRLLCQRVAQRANQEEEESGRFFQDRYKAVRLLDEASLVACAAYVDLNPIRAAMAETLEESDHTSVQRRIAALVEHDSDKEKAGRKENARGSQLPGVPADSFLSPIDLQEAGGEIGPVRSCTGKRCSDKGFLWFATESYLELLDWTARQQSAKNVGQTPAHLAPILKRLGMSPSAWCELVADFGKLFHNVAGHPVKVDAQRSRRTGRRFRVRPRTRELFLAA